MLYNIINNFFSWFTTLSCVICGIYIKYRIDSTKLKKMCELFEDICERNAFIIDYVSSNIESELVEEDDTDIVNTDENSKQILETKYANKYAEKYIQKFKMLKNDCNFSEEEYNKISALKNSIKKDLIDKYKKEINENNDILNNINNIDNIISTDRLENNEEGIELLLKYFDLSEEFKEDPENVDLEEYLKQLKIDKESKETRLKELVQMTETYDKTDAEIEKDAYDIVLKEYLLKHKNNYVLEYTPLGNVYMRYNSEKETFEYFSDSTLPYRYLETVARKYVITFFCRPIYIDIEEELKNTKNENINGNSKQSVNINIKPTKETLEIINKIKSKNANVSLNAQVNLANIKSSGGDNIVLKERANRYTWEGRLHDFCPLKKIDKKIVDKRLNITFSEFKKMMLQNKK